MASIHNASFNPPLAVIDAAKNLAFKTLTIQLMTHSAKADILWGRSLCSLQQHSPSGRHERTSRRNSQRSAR